MSILRDPIWQFVGAVIAVLALGFTSLFAWRQRRSKRLICVPRIIPLLAIDSAIRGDVEVLFKGRRVQNVTLIELRLVNLGTIPIEPRDFTSALRIAFGSTALVLSAETVEASPAELRGYLTIQTDAVAPHLEIQPVLMNPTDTFKIKFLVAGFEALEVLCRISGIKIIEIRSEEDLSRYTNQRLWRLFLPVTLALLLIPAYYSGLLQKPLSLLVVLLASFALVEYVVTILARFQRL